MQRQESGIGILARDDGQGAERIVFGLGLSGLEQRFARLGGRLGFQSAKGAGFRVQAWLP